MRNVFNVIPNLFIRSNCISDCYIETAMKHCSCIPWDYPTPTNSNISDTIMICDFYGNSCFNSYIENGFAEKCKEKCVRGCNEIIFSMTTEREPIKSENICKFDPDDYKNHLSVLEREASNYIRNSSYVKNKGIMRFLEALTGNAISESLIFEYCTKRMVYDIAMVDVVIESPTVIKYIQNYKASLTDKVGNFGGNLGLFTGMSILSICEIVFWIVRIILRRTKTNRY